MYKIILTMHLTYGTIYLKVGEIMEKPKLIYQKNADKLRNRIIIPQSFIDKHGNEFIMEIFEDKIILKPLKKA